MKKVLILVLGLFLMMTDAYAGNGDLIVNGNVGIGTASPSRHLTIEKNVADVYLQISNTAASGRKWSLISSGNGSGHEAGSFAIQDENAGTTRFYISTSGNVGIGATNPGSYKLYVNGVTYSYGGYQSSDSKFKKEIKQIDSALDKVNNLTGVSYLYKTDEYKDKGFPEGKQLGVIAQELEKVIPEAVMTDEEGMKAVSYSMIIPVLIEAIKSQQKEIDDLQSMVTQLQSKSK